MGWGRGMEEGEVKSKLGCRIEEEERILEEKVLVSACGHNLENKYLS